MTPPIGERPGMAAYGTDTADWQPLPWEWAAERLVPNRNYWVVTVSAAGAPHALPVWGVWDDHDLRFMFSCAFASRKARNMAANPRVVFTIADTVECISIEGTAAPISDALRAKAWIDRYVAKYGPEQEGLGEFLPQNAMYEVKPRVAFAVIEREAEFATRATRWRFT
jgi:nitroimidazol reductase NimA-like FMN-containing flavoprotein (pyridoxamine 5'-phosphate oxidase superfamily)